MADKKPKRTKRTKEAVIQALQTYNGLPYLAAQALGISPQTLWNYRQRWPELEQVILDAQERMLDTAELALQQKILSGDLNSIRFYLKTKGKHRSYSERPTAPSVSDKSFNWDLLAEEIPEGPLPDVVTDKIRQPMTKPTSEAPADASLDGQQNLQAPLSGDASEKGPNQGQGA